MDRRMFLSYSAAAVTALAQQWATTEPGTLARALDGKPVDSDLVDWLETTGTKLTTLATEQRQHTQVLLDAHLKTVTDLIEEGRFARSVGLRLHGLAASLAQTVGWQRFDQRRHAAAGRFWHAALHSAHAARERDLGAGILSDLAYQATWLNDPRSSVDILEYAIPRTQHPTARSLLHLRLARAQAALGQEKSCRRSLTASEQHLEAHSPDPVPTWCAWMSPADLAVDSGRCLADLGQAHRAHQLIGEGMNLLPRSRDKTRAIFLTYQADSYLRSGDPEQAAIAAAHSLELASRIGAPRCVTMAQNLAPGFGPYANAQGVPELLDALASTR